MIGVIADDLSGAAELGALGWRHGLRAEIIGLGMPSQDADLVCVDTDSRSVTPEEAGRRVSAAARLLVRSGAAWIYKKVDSVLRGHVVVEIEAILKQLDWKSALLVPANPARGRTIRNGQYFINGKPIHETEFGHDPEYPRASADVMDLLGGPANRVLQTGNVRTPQDLSGIVVGEAESNDDLDLWVERRSPGVLMSGAAEFFGALLGVEGSGFTATNSVNPAEDSAAGEIFVCGSLSEATAQFVETARRQGTPVFRFPETPSLSAETDTSILEAFVRRVVSKLQAQSRVVLATPSAIAPDSRASRNMAQQLTRLACAVMQRTPVSHFYVEGGATAARLVRRMDWERLTVVREVAPGVVTLEVAPGQLPLLTIKPGSYVWPGEIQRDSKLGYVVG